METPSKTKPKSDEEPAEQAVQCPHHNKTEIIRRKDLTKKQYIRLLATPKGRKFYFEYKKKPCESETSLKDHKTKKKGVPKSESVCSCCKDKKERGQGDLRHRSREKPQRKKCRVKSLKPCEKTNPYLHSFLADVWAYLTPEIIDTLKEMLIKEFGMKPREAEEFMIDQRLRTMFKGTASQPKPLPCFPFPSNPCPPSCLPIICPPKLLCIPCPSSRICPPCIPCPPCRPGQPCIPAPPCIPGPPCMPSPPCIPIPRAFSPPCIPCPPCPPSPPHYPCCTSPEKIICLPKRSKKSRKFLGLRHYWIKEMANLLSIKLNDYVAMMVSTRRSKKVRYISECILKHLCDITGERCTLSTAKTRAQKIMVFIADRTAIWLANILCSCDEQIREVVNKRIDKEQEGEDEDKDDVEEQTSEARVPKKKKVPNKPAPKDKPQTVDEGDKDVVKNTPPSETSSPKKTASAPPSKSPRPPPPQKPKPPPQKSPAAGPRPAAKPTKAPAKPAPKPPAAGPRPAAKPTKAPAKPAPKPPAGRPPNPKPTGESNPGGEAPNKTEDTGMNKEPSKEEIIEEKTTGDQGDKTEDEDIKPEGAGDQESKDEKQVDEVLKDVVEEELIGEQVTAPSSDRADDIASVVSEKLGGTAEGDAVDKVSKQVGTWVDKMVTEAEIDYVVRKPKGKAAFRVKRNKDGEFYLVKQIPSEIVCKAVKEGRYKDETKETDKYDIKLKKPKDTEPLNVDEIKDWANFATDVLETVKKWGGWIEKTCTEAEEKFGKEKTEISDSEELNKWKIDTQAHALRWKQNKLYLKEAAQIWQTKVVGMTGEDQKSDPKNITESDGNNELINEE